MASQFKTIVVTFHASSQPVPSALSFEGPCCLRTNNTAFTVVRLNHDVFLGQ